MKIILLVLSSLLLNSFSYAKTVCIVPFDGVDVNRYYYQPFSHRDEVALSFCMLRERLEKEGYTVKITSKVNAGEDYHAILVTGDPSRCLQALSHHPKEKRLLFIFEPPVISPHLYTEKCFDHFGKVFSLLSEFEDGKRCFKFYRPNPRLKMIEDVPSFSEKKFCTMISSSKKKMAPREAYSDRFEVIDFFKKDSYRGEFDLYGTGWGAQVNYKGTVVSKWNAFSKYKYAFCYENMKDQEGYITEKIFDCMVGGCIPIYLGASDITDYIPADCFIDRRDFDSMEMLYQFLCSIDQSDYNQYIENIREYFKSPAAQVYSAEYFSDFVINELNKLK